MVGGFALYLYTGAAIAQALASGPQGPTWETWFTLAGSALMMLGGAYVRGLNGRVNELQSEIKALANALADVEKVAARDQAHAKAAQDTLAEVKLIALSVQRRLDQLHVNSAFPGS